MVNLTFAEQVKIILSRKGMTIKQLAEMVEAYTGKPMSRQNMTQRLGRDNFQEQDMRLIAEILGCKFTLSIMEEESVETVSRDITMGELVELLGEAEEPVEDAAEISQEPEEEAAEPEKENQEAEESEERKLLRQGIRGYFRKTDRTTSEKPAEKSAEKTVEKTEEGGEINPYTGKEYKTNSVRMHPKRIGYVQVYDREQHKWTDMTEWAFLGYQERKKVLLGKDYVPPTYLD